MLDLIQGKFNDIFNKLRFKRVITEQNVKDAIRDIRLSLLEADVNYQVVKDFINEATNKALGAEVIKGVNPAQKLTKVFNDLLTDILGGKNQDLSLKPIQSQTVIMLVGLQGAGKTTTAVKLANHLKERKPLLVACDIYRPAAIDQLKQSGEENNIPVFSQGKNDPVKIAKDASKFAKKNNYDTLIVDTAGRLQIETQMMKELTRLKAVMNPSEILLVADAMIGQKAAEIAHDFNQQIGLTGVILTKFDSDTRGGAAFSIKKITGRSIKFIGVGEKVNDFEPFYPDRMASRILGMGDVVSLVEKAEQVYEEKEAQKLEKKLKKGDFNFQDFLNQIQQVRKMGSMEKIMGMIPGMDGALAKSNFDEKEMKRQEAMILSMTMEERENHWILGPSRRKRIAKGSGVTIAQVNKLIKNFQKTRQMLKKFGKNKNLQESFLNQLQMQ